MTDLYSIAAGSAYSTDFNDITTGNSIGTDSHGLTYSPGTGYDLATGLGSPNTQALMPTLVGSSTLAFGQQPTPAAAGAIMPTVTVDVENSAGSIVTSDNSYVTLSLGTNPFGGRLLGTTTVQAVNGVATFSGLWVDAAGTGYTLIATDGELASATSNAFNITANAAQPVLVTPASAGSNPVTTTSTSLSVQASDPNSQSLTYTWSAVSVPSGAAAPTFSPNGTTAASATTATFSARGAYTLDVVFTDSSGYSRDSSISVSVVSTAISLGVSPSAITISADSQEQFSAVFLDQFGNNLGAVSLPVTWSAAGGTITSTGLYTTPASGTSDTVTVTSGSLHGSTTVTIAAPVGWWIHNQQTGTTANDSGSGTPDAATITGGTWVQRQPASTSRMPCSSTEPARS